MDLAVHELEEEQEVVVLPPVGQAQDMGVVVHSEVVNSLYSGEVVPGLPFLVAPEHRHPGTDQIIIVWWAWCGVLWTLAGVPRTVAALTWIKGWACRTGII